MVAHCLFEQSGTFKNEFKKLGYEAYDYDILNDYGETDYQIDLFEEIEKAYLGGERTIFDGISQNDIILAFFPCVRFENQIMLSFRGQRHGMEEWSYRRKMLYDMQLLSELKHNYDVVNKMFIVCIDKALKLIMENPFSEEHFLRRYWCYPPSIIDRDRRMNGDLFKKPTQYWFLNITPKNNLVFEPLTYIEFDSSDAIRRMGRKDADIVGAKTIKQARSTIQPEYANRFIRQYLIDESEVKE